MPSKEYYKKYRENNKEKIKEYQKEWEEQNKDKVKAKYKRYYEKNKERIQETKKNQMEEYLKTDQGKKLNRVKNWRNNGLICEDYDKLYEHYLNTWECDNCGIELVEGNYGANRRCMDHSHRTGLFRNILCHTCNSIRPLYEPD